MITIREVKTKSDLRKFARFPVKLYKKCPLYVPSFYSDEMSVMDPSKNFSLPSCEVRCFLAERDGKVVGRVAGIIQKKRNALAGTKNIRFSRFDFVDDAEVAQKLLDAVAAFGKERGMDTIHGPWGFNDQDREGMLTEGFDKRATYATNYNFPYYAKHVQALGFEPESEWVEYNFTIPEAVDARIKTIANYVEKKLELTEIAGSAPMKELIAKYGHAALAMVNEAYSCLDEYVPLEGKEMDNVLDQFATIINPRYFSFLVDKTGTPVGMGVIIPSIAEPLIKGRGRMTPLTILRLLRAIKKPRELEMALVAVRPDYQKKGVNSLMMARISSHIIEDKIRSVESNPELVTNLAVQTQWTSFEREIIKRRKTFVKKID